MPVTKEIDDLSRSTRDLSLGSPSLTDKVKVKPQRVSPFKRLFTWNCKRSRRRQDQSSDPPASAEEDKPKPPQERASQYEQPLQCQSQRKRWSNSVLVPMLSALEPNNEEWILPDYPYFHKVRNTCREYRVSKKARWENSKRLACGSLRFPVILLQSPSETHELPYDEMVENTPTLMILRQQLKDIGLSLDDVPIIDIFPVFTDIELSDMPPDLRKEALQSAFKLTLEFLDTFEITNIVALQSPTSNSVYVDHPASSKLCSSLDGAQRNHVREESIGDRQTNIVQGFHPIHFYRETDPAVKYELDNTLTALLRDVYQPCGEWKEKRLEEAVEQRKAAMEFSVQKGAEFIEAINAFGETFERASRLFHSEDVITDISDSFETLHDQIEQLSYISDPGPDYLYLKSFTGS